MLRGWSSLRLGREQPLHDLQRLAQRLARCALGGQEPCMRVARLVLYSGEPRVVRGMELLVSVCRTWRLRTFSSADCGVSAGTTGPSRT